MQATSKAKNTTCRVKLFFLPSSLSHLFLTLLILSILFSSSSLAQLQDEQPKQPKPEQQNIFTYKELPTTTITFQLTKHENTQSNHAGLTNSSDTQSQHQATVLAINHAMKNYQQQEKKSPYKITLSSIKAEKKKLYESYFQPEFYLLTNPPRAIEQEIIHHTLPYYGTNTVIHIYYDEQLLLSYPLTRLCTLNDVCDTYEDHFTCPQDCSLAQSLQKKDQYIDEYKKHGDKGDTTVQSDSDLGTESLAALDAKDNNAASHLQQLALFALIMLIIVALAVLAYRQTHRAKSQRATHTTRKTAQHKSSKN